MRYLIGLFLAVPLAVSAQAPEPSFRTTTSEVLLDLVVRDKHAQIIRDLRPDEIQVFEDGFPQKLRHFEFFDRRKGRQESPASTPSAGVARSTSAPASPMTVNELREMSVVSIVIANLDPRDRALTVDAMRQFVKGELKPNMYVGVFRLDMGGLHVLQPYTNDGEKISAAVVQAATSARTGVYQGVGLRTALDEWPVTTPEGLFPTIAANPTGPFAEYAMPTSMFDTVWVGRLDDAYQTSVHTIAPLHELVSAQASIPGRKVLLLFMSGLPMSAETIEARQSVISAANRANVTIYAFTSEVGYGFNDSGRKALMAAANASMQQQLAGINGGDQTITPTEVVAMDVAAQAVMMNSTGNLADLAEATGGALLRPSADMREPLREALEGVRTHYELTYSPTDTAIDGSFRKIEVKVMRPGATVFARSGYYAVPLVNGRQVYPFEIATLKALNVRPYLHQFDFHDKIQEFRPGVVRNQLAFIFQAPTKDLTVTTDQQWAKVHVCVTALIKDSKGEVVEKISKDIAYGVPLAKKAELEEGTVSFTAPFFLAPGHYTVDTAAVDRLSMKASVNRSMLDVHQAPGFSMSDVMLARRVDAMESPANSLDPLEARGAKVTPELSGTVQPEAGESLRIYAVAYPLLPVDAPVEAHLEIWRDGNLLMRSPVSQVPADASGAASILASLPLEKITSGSYDARVSFQYKDKTVTKRVAFTIGKGN